MNKLEFKICAGIGDNIVLRMALDTVKHNYDEIRISHNKDVIAAFRDEGRNYDVFLHDLGTLLFSEPPYIFDQGEYPEIYTCNTYKKLGIVIKEPKLDYLLCKGKSLDTNGKYIALTTRARTFLRRSITVEFWHTLIQLSNTYKIVVMGEREIEGDKGFVGTSDEISSIYDLIISNLGHDRIIDLTTPKLGVSAFKLENIQQDCLIMKEAEFVITFGIGGNVWMSAAVANTIGYRTDNEEITNIVVNPHFSNIFITKDWNQFVNRIK